MGMTLLISPGMAVITLALLLSTQSSGLLASGFDIESTVCGADHIAYTKFLGREVFYLNGNLVDEDSFCKSLRHHTKDCVLRGYLGSCYGDLDLSLDFETQIQAKFPIWMVLAAGLVVKHDRKLLQDKEIENKFTSPDLGLDTPKEIKNDPKMFSTYKKAGIAATGAVVMFCAFFCPCFYRKKKAAAHTDIERDPSSKNSVMSFDASNASEIPPTPLRVPPSPSRFSMSPNLRRLGSVHLNVSQVVRATRNFSPALQIGEGGFGTVYKAHLEDGHVVAIKRAKKEFFESLLTEFSSEVELLAKIDHRNLVKLLGYVDKENERLIITEYVPNGTLREHLDGQRGKVLDFNQRLEIAIDVAHALTYLHLYSERQIIHRDVKSSNILLTETMRAKVADFGFARLGGESDRTHVSTKVKGTVGYLDPEYMKTYHLTPKSDVYSFGILLIEILTGRRPVEMRRPADERVTLRWAFRKYDEGALVDMMDPLMEDIVDTEILRKMFSLAIQCAAPVRADRPDMKSAAEQLWGIRADYLKSVERRVIIEKSYHSI